MFSSFLALMTTSTAFAPFIANVNSCPHSATESKAFRVSPVRDPIRSSVIVRSSAYFTGITKGGRHKSKLFMEMTKSRGDRSPP